MFLHGATWTIYLLSSSRSSLSLSIFLFLLPFFFFFLFVSRIIHRLQLFLFLYLSIARDAPLIISDLTIFFVDLALSELFDFSSLSSRSLFLLFYPLTPQSLASVSKTQFLPPLEGRWLHFMRQYKVVYKEEEEETYESQMSRGRRSMSFGFYRIVVSTRSFTFSLILTSLELSS